MRALTFSGCTFEMKYDVALLADESGGNSPQVHSRMLNVIRGVIDSLTFTGDSSRLAFATFSNHTAPRWSLSQYESKRQLLDLVSLGKSNLHSDVPGAINSARNNMFLESSGHRANANNIIIVLVDVTSYDGQQAPNIVSDLHDENAETTTVLIVAFGDDSTRFEKLATLASGPREPFITKVSKDSDVQHAIENIINTLCVPTGI